jgi:RNA polymerase sigma-70 factor (ECF subfamily)
MQHTDDPLQNWPHLLAAAQTGDASATERLLDLARCELEFVAANHLPLKLQSKLSAADLVQQSLCAVVDELPAFRGESFATFQCWLEQIIRRQSRDVRRKFLHTERRDVRREVHPKHPSRIVAAIKTPSSIARRVERDEQLAKAVAELPDNYRIVIQLRHKDGLSWEQASTAMGTSPEAARKLWSRAIKKLQQKLAVAERKAG